MILLSRLLSRYLFILLVTAIPMLTSAQSEVLAIDWVDLISQKDLDAILNAPTFSHDEFGWEEQLDANPENEAYMNAMRSFDVNPDLVNQRIMISGFIVPTAYDEERKVTEFFLVPFFGACLHLPPPPPNQIIHVAYESGVELVNMYDAYTVHGLLSNEVVSNALADSAYRLQAEDVALYSF